MSHFDSTVSNGDNINRDHRIIEFMNRGRGKSGDECDGAAAGWLSVSSLLVSHMRPDWSCRVEIDHGWSLCGGAMSECARRGTVPSGAPQRQVPARTVINFVGRWTATFHFGLTSQYSPRDPQTTPKLRISFVSLRPKFPWRRTRNFCLGWNFRTYFPARGNGTAEIWCPGSALNPLHRRCAQTDSAPI